VENSYKGEKYQFPKRGRRGINNKIQGGGKRAALQVKGRGEGGGGRRTLPESENIESPKAGSTIVCSRKKKKKKKQKKKKKSAPLMHVNLEGRADQ